MIDETIILLTYYYEPGYRNHLLLKHVAKNHLGVYLPFDVYLYEPLRRIFRKVVLYDYLKRMTEVGVRAVNEEIIALVREEHAKYVLWTSWQYDVQESTLETIRRGGGKVVGWFFDDDWRFDDYSRWWIPYLDYCVTNAFDVVPKYRQLGARVIHTTPNTGVAIERDWSNIKEKYDVSFVGSRNCADRQLFIDELNRRGLSVQVFGDGWAGYVTFEQMIEIFQTTRINLNFSKAVTEEREVLQIKGRVFQVCLAGGFMLTEYVPGIEEYFEIDKEIVCFKNVEDLAEKVTYYLSHDNERKAIARAGWERATNNHTSSHMVACVFQEIERDAVSNVGASGAPSTEGVLGRPMVIRMLSSEYHFEWARALIEENYPRYLWRDELGLSLSLNPFNIGARCYQAICLLPASLRPAPLQLYSAAERLVLAVRAKLGSVSFIARARRRIIDTVFYRRVRAVPVQPSPIPGQRL